MSTSKSGEHVSLRCEFLVWLVVVSRCVPPTRVVSTESPCVLGVTPLGFPGVFCPPPVFLWTGHEEHHERHHEMSLSCVCDLTLVICGLDMCPRCRCTRYSNVKFTRARLITPLDFSSFYHCKPSQKHRNTLSAPNTAVKMAFRRAVS